MLSHDKLIAFVATRDPDRALVFYRDMLGLTLIADEPHALVFDAHGTMLRVQKAPHHSPLPHTALGWQVAAIENVAAALASKGVPCERFPGLEQDAAGIWRTPNGVKVAWFKDPDGNLLSLTQS